jgi:RNA polymerase sigma-70 factor (ECF subfamily)
MRQALVQDAAIAAVARERAEPDELGALMARAQDGDRAAYRALLVAAAPIVRAQARRLAGARGDVEDIVQDVLLRVHEIRHTYDPARPFRPWLLAVARYRVIDALRRRGRTTGRETNLDPVAETFAADAAYLDSEATADGPALRRAIAELPPRQRRAIELLKLQERTLKEASVLTGQSVVSLKVAVHRAINTLRRRLMGGPA